MKQIVSWTQTYGDKRLLNLQLLKYDTIGNLFRDTCEYIIFSFHNCPDNFYNTSKAILEKVYSQEKLILLRFDNISYLQCYKNILNKAKNLNCSDILCIQDDQHGINSKDNVENLKQIGDIIKIYKSNNKIQHLHLFGEESIPKDNLQPLETITENNIKLYKYDSTDFKKCNIYAWNDGTYLIDINFMNTLLNLKNIPDNVWHMELFLKHIYDNNVMYRWGCNKILFKASNLFGRNINRNISPVINLKRFFGETENWREVVNLVI